MGVLKMRHPKRVLVFQTGTYFFRWLLIHTMKEAVTWHR